MKHNTIPAVAPTLLPDLLEAAPGGCLSSFALAPRIAAKSKLRSQHMHLHLLTTGVVLHTCKAEDASDCYMNMHVHMIRMLTPMYQGAQTINHRFVAS